MLLPHHTIPVSGVWGASCFQRKLQHTDLIGPRQNSSAGDREGGWGPHRRIGQGQGRCLEKCGDTAHPPAGGAHSLGIFAPAARSRPPATTNRDQGSVPLSSLSAALPQGFEGPTAPNAQRPLSMRLVPLRVVNFFKRSLSSLQAAACCCEQTARGRASQGRRGGRRAPHQEHRSDTAAMHAPASATGPETAVRSMASTPPAGHRVLNETPRQIARCYWQPDADAERCSISSCNNTFSWTLGARRHHCRQCGRVVCETCSRGKVRAIALAKHAAE